MSKKFLSPIKLAQGATVPSTGSAGELFYNTTDSKIYTHNGTAWVASGGGVTNSATAPSSPANGDAWFNTTEGTLFVYYADGTSGQWVESTPPIQSSEGYQLPAGSIMAWGGVTAPANWLLADGTAISRTTYASLFAAIGTQYGVGDGSTTFNLPNLKGRVVVGKDSAQTEFDTLGETGGAKTHTLTSSEMPSHTHTGTTASSGAHTHTGSTSTTGAHSHQVYGKTYVNTLSWNELVAGRGSVSGSSATSTEGNHNHSFTTDSSGAHTHTFTTDSAGSGGAHNNLQPYIVLNYVIKFSAGETPGDSQLATIVGSKANVTTANTFNGTQTVSGTVDATSFKSSGVSVIPKFLQVVNLGALATNYSFTLTEKSVCQFSFSATGYTPSVGVKTWTLTVNGTQVCQTKLYFNYTSSHCTAPVGVGSITLPAGTYNAIVSYDGSYDPNDFTSIWATTIPTA